MVEFEGHSFKSIKTSMRIKDKKKVDYMMNFDGANGTSMIYI